MPKQNLEQNYIKDKLKEKDIDIEDMKEEYFRLIDQDFFDIYDKQLAMGIKPHCKRCGSELKKGDRVDSEWAYRDKYNLCKGCLHELGIEYIKSPFHDLLDLIIWEDVSEPLVQKLAEQNIINLEGKQEDQYIVSDKEYKRLQTNGLLNKDKADVIRLFPDNK